MSANNSLTPPCFVCGNPTQPYTQIRAITSQQLDALALEKLRTLSRHRRDNRSVFAAECALRTEIATIDREIDRRRRRAEP
jgi:hypothetical protein